MKNAVFWVVTPYGSSKDQRFGGTYRLYHQGDKNRRSEVIYSSETSVLTIAKLHNIPEDDILHSQRLENLKSYIALTGWAL
jgi:hypothetical protein